MRAVASVALLAALVACAGPSPTLAPAGPPSGGIDTVAVQAVGPLFSDARAVAADGRGHVYVADAGTDAVYRLAPDLTVLDVIGGPGAGDYAFLSPADVDPTNGLALYVADSGNGRIQRFSHEGRLLESLAVPADPEAALARREPGPERGRPIAVAAAPAGEAYAIEERRGVVLRWDDRRSLERIVGGADAGRGALRQPVGLALLDDRRLAVADAGLRAVVLFDAFGSFQRRLADGLARDVRAVAASGDRLAVILPGQVLVYDTAGMLLRTVVVDVPEPLVGGAFTPAGLILLSASRLWLVP
jgi:hypothetical protein